MALLILPALLISPWIVRGAVPYFMDPLMYFFPLRWQSATLVAGGEMPWWSRSILCGVPLFSNPQAALAYPPHWLMLARPGGFSYTLPIALHLGLWSALTYALLRRLEIPVLLSLWGAALCLAGSYGWSRLQFGNYMNVLPWWPLWALAGIAYARPAAGKAGAGAMAAGSAAVAMMLLGGAHQLAAYGILGLGVFALVQMALDSPARLRWMAFSVGSAASGALIAAPGWLPQWAFLGETGRGAALDASSVLVGTVQSPLEILTALIAPTSDAGISISVGAFALAAAGLVPRKRILLLPWLGLWAAILATALPAWRPVAEFLLAKIPAFGAFHDPKRMLGVTQWLIVVAGAIGAAGWLEPGASSRWVRIGAAFIALCLGASSLLIATGPNVATDPWLVWIGLGAFALFACEPFLNSSAASKSFSQFRVAAYLGLGVFALGFGTLRHTPISFVEVGRLLNSESEPALVGDLDLQPGERFFSVDWKRDSSYDYRRFDLAQAALPNFAMISGAEDAGGYEPARTPRYDRWLASASTWPGGRQPWQANFGLPYPPSPTSINEAHPWAEANIRGAILPRWGVSVYLRRVEAGRWVGPAPQWAVPLTVRVAFVPGRSQEAAARRQLTVVFENGATARWRLDETTRVSLEDSVFGDLAKGEPLASGAEPQLAFEVHRLEIAHPEAMSPDPPALRLQGFHLELDPEDQLANAYLWSPAMRSDYEPVAEGRLVGAFRYSGAASWTQCRDAQTHRPVEFEVMESEISANQISIRIWNKSSTDAVLEVHDAFWPGWKGEVNGEETGVRPSGPDGRGLWRWITIPPGESTITMKYRPPLLMASLFLSMLGIALLAGCGGWLRRKGAGPAVRTG